MPFPPVPPPARTPGVPAARPLFRRPCAPSPPAAAGEKTRRPPETPRASSWPSATLKRPPARRGPGPGPPQPPAPVRAPPQASPSPARTPATCAAPRRVSSGRRPAGAAAAGAGPDDALRFSLSLTPEAVLVVQRRHLERQLPARPRRPTPSPSGDPRRALGPCLRARGSGLRRGGAGRAPDAPLAGGLAGRLPCASLLPGGLQAAGPSPRPPDLRPVLKVSLLNDRHKYDDVEYEEEEQAGVVDEGLVRKCTEWLRGVESAAAGRGRTGHLDSLPHLSTL